MNNPQQQPSGPAFVPVQWPYPAPSVNYAPPMNEVPARVRAALDYLSLLTVKGMTRAAVNDITIELIDGQDLTPSEERARGAACDMLTSYFRGDLQTNLQEQVGYRVMLQHAGGQVLVERPCPVCKIPGVDSCPYCGGTGRVQMTETR